MSCTYAVDQTALLKLLLHSLKYPCFTVNGILLGEEKIEPAVQSASPPTSPRGVPRRVLHIYDAIPVTHSFPALTSPLEAALVQLQAYCDSKTNLRVVGYYQCNDRMQDDDLGIVGRRIADRIESLYSGSVALTLDAQALRALIDGKGQAPPVRLLYKDASRGWTFASSKSDVIVRCATGGVKDLLTAYISEGRHHRLADFEDHFEDVSADWLNPDLLE